MSSCRRTARVMGDGGLHYKDHGTRGFRGARRHDTCLFSSDADARDADILVCQQLANLLHRLKAFQHAVIILGVKRAADFGHRDVCGSTGRSNVGTDTGHGPRRVYLRQSNRGAYVAWCSDADGGGHGGGDDGARRGGNGVTGLDGIAGGRHVRELAPRLRAHRLDPM